MTYAYLVISAALVLFLNNFFEIMQMPYSWWLVPVLFLGFFVCFIILQMLIMVIFIWLTDMKKEAGKGAAFLRFLIKQNLPIILWIAGVKINFSAEKELPQNTRMLFVCNHQHDFDPVIMLSCFPDAELGFLGKKDIYSTMPFIAKAMHRIYSLPIDRENDREAAKTIIKAIKIIKEDKASLTVFPEGKTSHTCELLPFRNGSLKIAMKAKVPIAVCVINNTRSILKNIFRRKTVVNFKLVDVIFPEEFENLNSSELGDRIYNEMLPVLNEFKGLTNKTL